MFELGRAKGLILSVIVVDEEDSLDVGVVAMLGDEVEGFFQTHDHEGGGHSIGIPCLAADYRDAQQRMADGETCGGVDGVGIAHAVFLVVLAIISRGDYRHVVQADSRLDFLLAILVLGGAFDTHSPRLAVMLEPLCNHLAPNIDKIALYAEAVEHASDEIDGIALGDSIEVKLYPFTEKNLLICRIFNKVPTTVSLLRTYDRRLSI